MPATFKLRMADFEILSDLGVGTVGTVYRARMRRTGELVALKVLLPMVSRDPLVAARFEREMVVLEKLSHPNIVHYHGGGREGSQLFFAMELVDSGSLKELLASGDRLSWQEAASCGRQICSALQHAHNHGVIHRDLKPANLYLTRSGLIKLGDFGIARDLHSADITTDGMTVGTYAYMSPEQIRGERQITGKTDLYALGCLLFEMLSGRTPYVAASFPQLFDQHLNSPPPSVRDFAPDCPAELDQLIQQLLQKDPEQRPFNARQVQGILIELLEQAGPPPQGTQGQGGDRESPSPADVAAGDVGDHGQLLLRRRLSVAEGQSRDVPWTTLLAVAAVLILVIAVAAALK